MIALAALAVVLGMAPMLRRAIRHHRAYWHIRQPGRPTTRHGLFIGPTASTRLW